MVIRVPRQRDGASTAVQECKVPLLCMFQLVDAVDFHIQSRSLRKAHCTGKYLKVETRLRDLQPHSATHTHSYFAGLEKEQGRKKKKS